MARPRRDTPVEFFSSTEMAVGSILSARTFALLKEAGIAPDPIKKNDGRNAHSLYDSEGLEWAGVIGGFCAAGMPPFLAARLARAFYSEWRACGYTGLDKLSRLNCYWREAAQENRGLSFTDCKDTYAIHQVLRTKTKIYKPNIALRDDMVVEIVDRKYVFEPSPAESKLKIFSPVSGSVPASPAYRIEGWERGAKATISAITDEVPSFDFVGNLESAKIYKKIETEFLNARENAVGLLRVNVSLAVRNAFDAVHDFRVRTGGAGNWSISATRTHNRYVGVDDEGLPLDPNHPWNIGLSPLERARRLVEIEEYLERRNERA